MGNSQPQAGVLLLDFDGDAPRRNGQFIQDYRFLSLEEIMMTRADIVFLQEVLATAKADACGYEIAQIEQAQSILTKESVQLDTTGANPPRLSMIDENRRVSTAEDYKLRAVLYDD